MPEWGPQITAQFTEFVDDSGLPAPLLDANDGVNFAVGDGWALPSPELRQEVVPVLSGDGARIPSSAYDLRRIRLPLIVSGGSIQNPETGSFDTLAANVRNLNRILDRQAVILRWKVPGMTWPLYFRVLRSPQHNYDPYLHVPVDRLDLDLLAEPFGYRPRVDFAGVTVTNDPAASGAGVNPLFFDVSGVQGDVDTPALVQLVGTAGTSGLHAVLAVRQRGTPSYLDQMTVQAEAMALGADATVVNDASMSGGQCVRVAFPDQGYDLRLSGGAVPGGASGGGADAFDQLGLYRVYAVVRCVTALSVIRLRLEHTSAFGGDVISGDEVLYEPEQLDIRQRIDLGLMHLPAVDFPAGVGPSGRMVSVDYRSLQLYAQIASGAGALDVDYFQLAPADESLCDMSGLYPGQRKVVLDAYQDKGYFGDPDGNAYVNDEELTWLGGLPSLVPNQVNRFYLLREDASSAGMGPDVKTRTTEVRVSYWPRYLNAPTV